MGPDEYSREVPGLRRAGPAQQRLHQRHGGVGDGARPRGAGRSCPAARVAELAERIGLELGRGRALARHPPEDDGALPRRRHHQPVRGLRAPRGVRLGGGTGRSTATSSASTGSSRPRATRPIATRSSKQADVLMLFYLLPPKDAAPASSSARLLLHPRHRCGGRSTTTCPAPATARRSARSSTPPSSTDIDRVGGLGALPGGAAERLRRRAGRHHPGGHPPRGHGRHGGHRLPPLRRDRPTGDVIGIPPAAARGPRAPAAAGAAPRAAGTTSTSPATGSSLEVEPGPPGPVRVRVFDERAACSAPGDRYECPLPWVDRVRCRRWTKRRPFSPA